MKLKNILLVVKDIEVSKAFYKEVFGLQVLTDLGEKVILTEGLVLQTKSVWEAAIGKDTVSENHMMELYFEENCIDNFVKKLEDSRFEVQFLNTLSEQEDGRQVVRFYDPDMHVIEVAESFAYVERKRKGLV